jgi:ABC-2 type transport system ATP-binding protein
MTERGPDTRFQVLMDGPPVLEAFDLRKHYGERVAVDGVAVSVNAGEIVGLLGPNGAGKTTTLSMLAGTLDSDSGTVRIAGHDLRLTPALARRRLGFVPQSVAVYPTLTAVENLDFFGRIQVLKMTDAREATAALLEEVGLTDRANDIVRTFSGGMKRRLNLACGMLHGPQVLLLDEATAGVDPQSRELIFAVIKNAAAHGTAILYSTHYMEEAELLCNRVILIDHGHIVAEGTVRQLVGLAGVEGRVDLMTRVSMPVGWAGGLAGARELAIVSNGTPCAALAVHSLDERVPEIISLANKFGGGIVELHLHPPNLQDAFIALTGHALRDAS